VLRVFGSGEGFRTRVDPLLLPDLAGRFVELLLQLLDLALEFLDVVDGVRQGVLLAHLNHTRIRFTFSNYCMC
jgi:hypothetical protein